VTKVGVLVIHFGDVELTKKCIASISDAIIDRFEVEVTVVDNDPDSPFCDGRFTGSVLTTSQNKGFANAVNTGIDSMSDFVDFILILNNDTRLVPDTLKRIVDRAQENPDKIIGPMILEEGTGKLLEKGGTVNGFSMYFKEVSLIGRSPVIVGFLTGAALFGRTETFNKIGRFDERFFMYAEDLDWCLRAKDRQVELLFDPGVRIYHKKGAASGGLNPFAVYYIHRNRVLLAKKRHSLQLYVLFVIVYSFLIGLKLVKWSFKDPRLAKWFLYGFFDGLKGKTGKADYPFFSKN